MQPPSGAIHVLPSGFATNYCTNTAGVSFLCLRFAGPMLAVPAQAFPRAGNGTSLHFRASASSWAGAARKRSPWGERQPRVPRCFLVQKRPHMFAVALSVCADAGSGSSATCSRACVRAPEMR